VASAHRREHLSAIAHDLRSPIAAARAAGQALLRQGLDETTRLRLAAVVTAAATQLSHLADDLERAALLDDPELALTIEACDLPAIATAAVDAAALTCPPGVELKLASFDTGFPPVAADPARLRQVLDNLIGNACRHGARRVEVRLELSPSGAAAIVTDDGPGIAAADQERIFEPFTRLDGAPEGGRGLGLAIARGLVARMNGQLTVSSEPGRGASFTVGIPAADRDTRYREESHESPAK
jgi:signal transduction histidine kinase